MQEKNKIVVVVEPEEKSETGAGERITAEVNELMGRLGLNDVAVILHSLPRDPRHASKIDYRKLRGEIFFSA